MKVTILSKDGCSMCDAAEAFLSERDIEYERLYVDKDTLIERCGKRVTRYPQIIIDGNHIGDNFEMEDYIDETYEPLLNKTLARFTVFPIKYPTIWEIYKKAQMVNWTAEEVDLGKDMDDWNKLNDGEHHFIKHILAFFASSDGIVFENINMNFAEEIQIPESRSFYAYQSHNEMVHGEMYSLLLDKYITDYQEKEKAFNAIQTIPCIANKAEWAMKWFDKSRLFSERLLAFACIEGVFFSGSFCAIYWLKKRGLMPGLCFSNELISRDEATHLEHAVELFKFLRHKPSQTTVERIIKDAVSIEKEFIIDALPCKLVGMDSDKMSEYIEFVADRMLKQLGYKPVWNTQNPFDFMETISLTGKTNFFEKRVGEYAKCDMDGEITFNEDF